MRSFDREKMRQDLILAYLGSDLRHHFYTMKEHFESVQALLAFIGVYRGQRPYFEGSAYPLHINKSIERGKF